MTRLASSTSWWLRASIARSREDTTMSSPPSACCSSRASSSWKWTRGVSGLIRSAHLAGDVGLRALVVGVGEDLLGLVVLHDVAGPVLSALVQDDGEEGRPVRHAGGLLHVVGDDHDRVLVLELDHEVLDPSGGDRVQ